VKQSVDFGLDDHPEDADRAPASWAVSITDDCEECQDLRVEVTLEEKGERGRGVTVHLSPAGARRVRAALTTALRELGEEPRPAGGG
jgi:hypothetical protein